MIEKKVPHNALVVVADGTGARFFRNSAPAGNIALSAEGELKPAHLTGEGPSGKIPSEQSAQEIDEATFAKQLANELNRRSHENEFAALVLIADPQTLGQIRPLLHKEVKAKLATELAKTLTHASVADIQKSLLSGA